MLVLPLGIILDTINSSPLMSAAFKQSIEQHNEHRYIIMARSFASPH